MVTPFQMVEQNEWILIAPLGDHPHAEGMQRITSVEVARMTERFNGFLARLGRLFAGIPIFRGHPDTDPERYPDTMSYGWVMELQDRGPEGLWGRVKWTEEGFKLVKGGSFKFISPVWRAIQAGVEGGRTVYLPVALMSIGLTNTPNLVDMPPLSNEKNHMKALTEILALDVEANADEICAAAETLSNARKVETERAATLANDLAEALKRVEAEREARIGLVLENAILAGRLELAEQEHWRGELGKDFVGAEKALRVEKKKLNVESQTRELGNAKGAYDTEATRRSFLTGFMTEKMAGGMGHQEAWEMAKAMHPAIFAKMTGKG